MELRTTKEMETAELGYSPTTEHWLGTTSGEETHT